MYYCQSRYYDPATGRFINADAYASTGQGILGNNMFAYCNNNPINQIDISGANAEALAWWTTTMSWAPFADAILPFGDAIYLGGIILLGGIALTGDIDCVPEISYDDADVAYNPLPPNMDNNDDDDEDDYDDRNFGGRQKVGKSKGKAPRSNRKQNKDFDYAAKKAGISPKKRRAFHDYITGQGYGLDELIEIAETFK